MIVRWLTMLLMVASIGPTAAASAPAKPDLVVLVVGSERYAKPGGPDVTGFAPLTGVADGARRVADLFRGAGARRVRLLASDPNNLVSRADILAAVDATVGDARQSPDALVVVYIVAHGISEGLGWSHYSVPVTMTFQTDIASLASREGVERHAVAAAELVDRLEQSGRHFLVILDTCRAGQERDNSGVRETLGEAGVTLVDTVRLATRQLNEFRGPNPVLFSTSPGTSVPTAIDPDDKFASVGPLARRILLWSRKKTARRSLAGLVAFLTDRAADPATSAAVTYAQRAPWWDVPLSAAAQPGPPLILTAATGERADPCCQGAPPPEAIPLSGSVRLVSAPAGHWLVAGEPQVLASPSARLESVSADAPEVTIEAEQGDRRWSLTLAAPSGASLVSGSYPKAQRAPFQSDGRPGLSFSITGKSCNEVAGAFKVRRYALAASRLSVLEAEAEMVCDDIPGVVRLRVDVSASPRE